MRLFSALACLLLGSVAISGAAQSKPLMTVGPNVQVSRARAAEPHYEIQLSADPSDARHLLGCAMAWSEKPGEFRPTSFKIVAYVSFDGGTTWGQSSELPGQAGDSQSASLEWSDPSCALGATGKAYVTALGYSGEKPASPIYRSNDGGRSFTLAGQWPFADREYVTLDQTQGKYQGRVYVHAAGGGVRNLDKGSPISTLMVAHSSDDGATFAPPGLLAVPAPARVFGVGNGVVLSDGTLVMVFGQVKEFPKFEARPTEPNGWLKALAARDGGERFSNAVVVDDWYMPTEHDLVANSPALAADSSQGPFHDRLYAAWADTRSGRYEILLSFSADKGKTWSKPTIVNDDRPRQPGNGPDDFMPVVAVNRDGVVAVEWYDRREQKDNLGWSTRMAVSLDGGEAFSPSVRVSESPFDNQKIESLFALSGPAGSGAGQTIETSIAFNRFHFQGGDTAGLAADAGGAFHPFWIDNRTGVPQIWTSTVIVNGAAVKNGDRALSELDDVTDRVTVEIGNIRYNPERRLAEFDVRIRNDSAEAIQGPLKLRVTSLRSAFDGPALLSADNQVGGTGAIFTFSGVAANGILNPGEPTQTRHLQVRFDAIGPVRPQPFYYHSRLPGLVSFDSRIFARSHQ